MDRNYKWKLGMLTALCVVLALVLTAMIFATAYVAHLLGQMNRIDPDSESTLSASQVIEAWLTDPDVVTIDPDSSETYIHIDDLTFPTDPEDATDPDSTDPEETEEVFDMSDAYGDHLVNILLVGQDRREGEGRKRSDSMILVSFNKSTDTITLTSFMRDQLVRIPGYQPNKLNAAYAIGGMKLLSKTMELNFGVQVDGVVEVDFGGFESIIDLLGGVDITMIQKEVDYFRSANGWEYAVGENHLTGEQALAYARLRSIDTDYNRAQRQRNVLLALINAYKDQPTEKLLGLLEEILPLITTNMSNSTILSYATKLLPMLSDAKLATMRIPVEGTYDSGMVRVREDLAAWFQYNINFNANRKILYQIFAAAD